MGDEVVLKDPVVKRLNTQSNINKWMKKILSREICIKKKEQTFDNEKLIFSDILWHISPV